MELATVAQKLETSADRNRGPLLGIAAGYALIVVTIWSARPAQRWLFWGDVVFFLCAALTAASGRRPKLSRPGVAAAIMLTGAALAGLVLLVAAGAGTLHPLFGTPDAFLHAGMYLTWAVVQQWIQQSFFFVRMERIVHRGVLASFAVAAMFALAHLPNPVLTPLTFIGGWIFSELFRRYRSVLPLGIAQGLIGLAVALAVPDAINHHMRVGLGYLQYPR